MRFVPQEGIEGVGFGTWRDVDAPWRAEIAWKVHKLVEDFDPDLKRFREMIRQHTVEAVARKAQYADDGYIHETGEDPKIDGVGPLFLGPRPSPAGKYATLAAIHDECLDAVRNRSGELVESLCPWSEDDEYGAEVVRFVKLKRERVPLLSEEEHGELIDGFLEDVRADFGGELPPEFIAVEITLKQLAEFAGVKYKTLANKDKAGRPDPIKKVGRTLFFEYTALARWFNNLHLETTISATADEFLQWKSAKRVQS